MTHAASKTESGNESKPVCHAVRRSLRVRLLSGAASLALPMASMIVTLGVCLPGNAQAQNVVNPVQNTTFVIDPTQNPIAFGAGTNIDTTAVVHSDGVFGAAGTAWSVSNQGVINSTFHGVSLAGAGSSFINSGTISATSNLVTSAGVFLGNGGTVTNQANGTISGIGGADGIDINGGAGAVTNGGTITSTDSTAIFLRQNGNVTNLQDGTITGKFFGILTQGLPAGTVLNTGSITATDTIDGVGVSGFVSSLTNQTGGTISGGKSGVEINASGGATVTNEQGATITGGTNGIITNGTLINAGSITATGAAGTGVSGNISSLTNQTGGTISGGQYGVFLLSVGATVTNEQGATMSGVSGNGVHLAGAGTSLTNSGTISGTVATGVFLNDGIVTNQNSGTITGGSGGSTAIAINTGTVTNAGTISSPTGRGIVFGSGVVTNETGGTISSQFVDGILFNGAGTVVNAGTISGASASVRFAGTGDNMLTLQTGSVLNGDAVGSSAAGATNKLVLQGIGTANNNFLNFTALDVQGHWTLNGNASVGTAAINVARLTIGDADPGHDSAVLIGDVVVSNLSTLTGRGTIAGNVNVMGGGFLDTSLLANFAALRVSGNVTFQNSSIYVVKVNSSGQASQLTVGGTATLSGGSVQVKAAGNFAPSTQYTILTATGGLNGTFTGGVTTNLAFLSPTLSYDNVANTVKLTLACNNAGACDDSSGGGGGTGSGGGTAGGGTGSGGGSTLFGFASVAQTPNQVAVATALDGGPTSNRLVTAVLNQSVDGARQAFDALSGEVYGSVHNAQAEEAQFARGAMLGRMRQASYAGAPGELSALGFAGPQLAYASATAAQASDYPVKAPMYGPSRDLTFWAQGLGGWGHSDGDGNAASLTSRFGGFLSGVDARFAESWRAGFAAGYVRTDLHANDRASSAGIDSVQLGAYATGRLGAFNVRGGGSYSFDDIDASRGIFFPGFTDQTKARLHGNVGQVFGEVGYGMALGNFALEPLAGLAYVHLRNGSFNESGGAAALTGSATHENMGYSSLGLRLASIMPLANGTVLVPRATLAWQYAFGDVTPSAALAFQGTGTAFSIAGVPVARNSALVDAGFDWRFTPQAKLGVSYLGELAANAQTHAIKGAFTWDF